MRSSRLVAAALAAASLALIAGGAAHAQPAATAAPAPPAAPPAAPPSDLRCLIIFANVAESDDPQAKQIGGLGLLYFWGRLEGKGSMAGIDDRLAAEVAKLSQDDVKTQADTCGAILNASIKSLTDAGQKLGQKIQASQAAAATAGTGTPPAGSAPVSAAPAPTGKPK
jgi:hypothetical protein